MRVKEESEKDDLKVNIQKTKILASGPITSWQMDGGKVEAMTDLVFLGSKIIADGDCSFEIKRCLLLGRKAMTNLDSIFKSKGITLLTKVPIIKVLVFLVVMYRCGSWTIKNAEHQKIDAFKVWCYRRLFRVPWTIRRSNQSTLKEINPEYSLEGLMLKLKLQHFGHLMWRADSLEKTLILVKLRARGEGGDRRWDGWMPSMDMNLNLRKCWKIVKDKEAFVLQSMGSQRDGHDLGTEQQQCWVDIYL